MPYYIHVQNHHVYFDANPEPKDTPFLAKDIPVPFMRVLAETYLDEPSLASGAYFDGNFRNEEQRLKDFDELMMYLNEMREMEPSAYARRFDSNFWGKCLTCFGTPHDACDVDCRTCRGKHHDDVCPLHEEVYAYVLECENGKYWVGKVDRLDAVIDIPPFLIANPPIKAIRVEKMYKLIWTVLLVKLLAEVMNERGIDNVRGAHLQEIEYEGLRLLQVAKLVAFFTHQTTEEVIVKNVDVWI